MNVKPIILLADYQQLRELIKRNKETSSAKEANQLSIELDRAIVIQKEELNKKIIRVDSEIEVQELKTKKRMNFQLVMPEYADLKKGKISILAPLGIALIGFSEGDEVNWEMPGGNTQIKILNVSNDFKVD